MEPVVFSLAHMRLISLCQTFSLQASVIHWEVLADGPSNTPACICICLINQVLALAV